MDLQVGGSGEMKSVHCIEAVLLQPGGAVQIAACELLFQGNVQFRDIQIIDGIENL